jgi:hypothetical protein
VILLGTVAAKLGANSAKVFADLNCDIEQFGFLVTALGVCVTLYPALHLVLVCNGNDELDLFWFRD